MRAWEDLLVRYLGAEPPNLGTAPRLRFAVCSLTTLRRTPQVLDEADRLLSLGFLPEASSGTSVPCGRGFLLLQSSCLNKLRRRPGRPQSHKTPYLQNPGQGDSLVPSNAASRRAAANYGSFQTDLLPRRRTMLFSATMPEAVWTPWP